MRPLIRFHPFCDPDGPYEIEDARADDDHWSDKEWDEHIDGKRRSRNGEYAEHDDEERAKEHGD